MLNVSFRIKHDKTELCKQKVTVTSAAVATMKFLLGTCDCTVDNDVGAGDFLRWGLCTCMDTLTCDRVCLRAWADPL